MKVFPLQNQNKLVVALPLVCNGGCSVEVTICLLCPGSQALCSDLKHEIASIQDEVFPEVDVLDVHKKVMSSVKGPLLGCP